MKKFRESFGADFLIYLAKQFKKSLQCRSTTKGDYQIEKQVDLDHNEWDEKDLLYREGDVIGISFRICGFIGQGGFGQVYRAYFRNSGKDCALKTFHDKFLSDSARREQFRKEAFAWVGLERHPNIVPAYLVEENHGRLFVAMEYIKPDPKLVSVDGKDRVSLFRYLSGSPVDAEQVLQWSIQFCCGMEHAYRHGIQAHLDIKPQNILIGQDGKARITDFGIAKTLENSHKDTCRQTFPLIGANITPCELSQEEGNIIWGTPGYIAPEVYREGPCEGDVRSDIYSFGLVIWQMASGSPVPPFHVSTQADPIKYARQVYDQQITRRPERINSSLWPLIERALKPDPFERYESFVELREELQTLMQKITGRRVYFPDKPEFNADSWINMGISLATLGKPEQAITCYDKAIAIDEKHVHAYINKGSALRCLGYYKEALDLYDKALEIGKDDRETSAYAWHGRANTLTSLARYEEAIDNYNKTLEIDSGFWVAWGGKAHVLELLGRDEQAIACYNEVIKRDSKHVGALTGKALTLQRLERDEEALLSLEAALAINPSDAMIWTDKGSILHKLGHYKEALVCYQRALEIDKKFVRAWDNNGRTLFNIHHLEEAISNWEQAIRLDPTRTSALFAKAVAEEKIGRKQDAIKSYRRFIEVAGPRDSWTEIVRNRLGTIEHG